MVSIPLYDTAFGFFSSDLHDAQSLALSSEEGDMCSLFLFAFSK